jgi:hypothetical protein
MDKGRPPKDCASQKASLHHRAGVPVGSDQGPGAGKLLAAEDHARVPREIVLLRADETVPRVAVRTGPVVA